MIFKYLIRRICIVLLFLALLLSFSIYVAASDNWVETSGLPLALASQYSFKYNAHVYSIGGSADSTYQANYYSAINSDDSLAPWENTSASLPPLSWIEGANRSNYVYILGGVNSSVVNVNSVYLGMIDNTTGDITNWQQLSPLPQELSLGASAISENYIFYAGGNTNSSDPWGSATQEIYKSTINLSDGTIGTWGIAGNLPEKMIQFTMLSKNGYLYIFGGWTQTGVVRNNVQRAQINSDGTINEWQDLPPLPKAVARSGITIVGDYIVSVGGNDGTVNLDNIYFSKFNSDGTITPWQTSPVILPSVNCCGKLISTDTSLYLIGGYDNSGYTNKVYYANASAALGIGQPTPTPIPVKKVVFIPGLGASWNADAILNCKNDNYQGGWDLASYATDIYTPILTALGASDWEVKPFYYDWRKQVPENASLLTNFVDASGLAENEKINMVGHSMGGLLGNEYLKGTNGNKLQSLLTLGTPFKGSALAYPPWAGGDIWNDNFLAKIALTIYLKHCGGLFTNDRLTIQNNVPSVQNLLPTEPYLQKIKTTTTYLPSHPINQNNLLNNSFPNPWGVRLGTIAGTGFSTLSIIQTKDPSAKDITSGNWLDGKPNGKLYATEGDGTVLTSSTLLPSASTSSTLNQTHTGLVASSDGIAAILEFLGTSLSVQYSGYVEPNSALVIIGYPGNFWISDADGNTHKDNNGMASIINPKSGSYKLNIIPQSNSTLLIVAQFLPNGQTLYKEYRLDGYGPKFKTLKFDPQNPQEDIVN